MTHRLLLLLCLALGIGASASVPVRYTLRHCQSDGDTLTVTVFKNARYSTFSTSDGLALLRGADGHFYYAAETAGRLQPTTVLAHEGSRRLKAEADFAARHALRTQQAAELLDLSYPAQPLWHASRAAASTSDGLGQYGTPGRGTVCSLGEALIPVIMVDFSDKAFQPENDSAKVTRFFNEPGYADEKYCKGSVNDFFVAQSNGLFSPSFRVVAHVTLDNGYQYYGANGSDGELDPNLDVMVAEAIEKASATVDFAEYATNGAVPLVTVMFAGPGEQSSFEDGHDDYLWARYSTRNNTANGGTVRISSFFVGNELLQSYGQSPNDVTGAALDGVGLFCHEFGHALGLPDFYYTGDDTEVRKSLRTMSYWDIMDYGQYYANGYAPPGYTAYERSMLGWLQVHELTEPTFALLYPFGQEDQGPTAYVIRNPENEKEYYLLENRQVDTWYPKLMGTGMLVLHVDYDSNAWQHNTVNVDPDRQRMEFVPADGVKEGKTLSEEYNTSEKLFNGYKGDLFPGMQQVTQLTDTSEPAMTVHTPAGVMQKPIYNIAMDKNGVISFSFLDETLTGLSTATTTNGDTPAYTPDGRRVASLRLAPRGIYLLPGGQKVLK